ncbi:uncharacterized protein BT62DRAFT_478816 [Guyanagaster necrorhizus]|uniref:Uncharacterized protein n=1 Tax=Guyanagaster necrorhizus TaxID=856835 RepID=A0A9P7VJ07_9AGAR|nr:uncharacterized protein BT62DRAFT_478816 [Guyanagaster necrorhizus MCA 3950]KAG7441458.1 hypothetical protein BT62DRAFT_478816 [Guyanagaster necrorhizus MCA 3950]
MGSEQSSTVYPRYTVISGLSSSTRTNEANEHEDHIPSDDEVISVKRTLNNYLPVEIIDDILDFAQYWSCIRERRRIQVRAAAVPTGETFPKADWCYIVSPPVPQDAKVRSVKFVIESCDQGYGGEPEHRGTYEGSWTWFEAAIICGEPWWLSEVLRMPVDLYREGLEFPEDVRSAARAAEVRSREEEGSRWHVGVNVTAQGFYKEHTIIWPRTNEKTKQRTMRGLVGLSHEFVRLLEPGDRVALMAMAMFPAWINKVKGASIDVFYTL